MGLFKRNYDKPGPGVPKNALRKKGFSRFIEILSRDLGNLFKLNLILVLCLSPAIILFTAFFFAWTAGVGALMLLFAVLGIAASALVGPALASATKIISKMLMDDPGFVWHDFKQTFKDNFKQAVVPGIIYSLLLAAQVISLLYYIVLSGGITFAMIAIYFISALLLALAAPYFFAQIPYLQLKNSAILKNSFLLAIGYFPRSLGSLLLGTSLIIAQFLFFPLALVITLTIGYAIPGLIIMMWIWQPMEKSFHIEETLRKRNSGIEDDTVTENSSSTTDEDSSDNVEDEADNDNRTDGSANTSATDL